MKDLAPTLRAYAEDRISLTEAAAVLKTIEWGSVTVPTDASRWQALADIPVPLGRSLAAEVYQAVLDARKAVELETAVRTCD